MTRIQSRIPTAPIEQLVCHPNLPLAAGIEPDRPAVHIYDASRNLREIGAVGTNSEEYGEEYPWSRKVPVLAWHPEQPELLVSVGNETVRWSPDGTSELSIGGYRYLAFSPDGQSLWASPGEPEGPFGMCVNSDVIDLGTGAKTSGWLWDTGVARHPAGGLVATLQSDQGATTVYFSREGTRFRVLDRALILDVDGYRLPVFSSAGRYLAVRGNSYENMVAVFEFPSLCRVLTTSLGGSVQGWPQHNLAFGAQLWIGTPSGSLIELDVERGQAVEHELFGSAISALATTSTGDLLVATGGELALAPVPTAAADPAIVADFLASTTEIPDDAEPRDHLVQTDGVRTWRSGDLDEVTEATPSDPTWLQLQAVLNARRR
ncbi:hypothetical protein F9C11_12115 [Amycolatopsis sp. VS8301801F10]|uniref:hypothetical protein n=1 Tax=Amycolatopsis sp. VS8301801F10 TaxID=2652442 RepID=UPI0038FD100A